MTIVATDSQADRVQSVLDQIQQEDVRISKPTNTPVVPEGQPKPTKETK